MDDLIAIALPALAMGLGWGIRGQFGHETGAMVPGALVGLALAAVSSRSPDGATALRLAAVGALACSLGGVMTYGQTLGLVHDEPHSPTRRWGLLGAAVKGAVWIGLTGAFLGMVGGGVRYAPGDVALLLVALAIAARAGLLLLNRPHDPPRALPRLYFSKRHDPRPRPEFWGGLWAAFLALLAYLTARGDWFAVQLALWGVVGGAAGFTGGEWLQAWGMHRQPFGARVQRWLDWWKVMEVTFGLVAGAALAVGWRRLEANAGPFVAVPASLPGGFETVTLLLWTAWLLAAKWGWRPAAAVWHASFAAVLLPLVGAFGGEMWPRFVVLPVLLFVSGDNVVAEWVPTQRLGWPRLAWAALLGLAVVPMWSWVHGGAPARPWLWLTVSSQTLLTVIWALGNPALARAKGSLVVRLSALGSALVVEVVFVLMAVLIALLAAGA